MSDWISRVTEERNELVERIKKLRSFLKQPKPENVSENIRELLTKYNKKTKKTIEDVIDSHVFFEKIHPFQDGNGSVGRLILFRECLRHNIVPFIIDERHKQFYYRGLREFASTPGYLLDTCLLAQDIYVAWVKYFYSGLFD